MDDTRSLEARLDVILQVEFSFRNTSEAAASIATLAAREQAYVIDWVERVASTNIELGFQYARRAVRALGIMELPQVESWALYAMDCYDREGLQSALKVMRGLDDFVRESRERAIGSVLDEQKGVLLGFLQGLSGRKLKIETSDQAYTDTETLFLPRMLARLSNPKDNFLLYKAMIAGLWAQTRYGTFRIRLDEQMAGVSEPEAFLELFNALETLRLEACIERELPGLARQLNRLKGELGEARLSGEWRGIQKELSDRGVTARDTLTLTRRLFGSVEPYPPFAYQCMLRPDRVAECMAARAEREKARFRVTLKLLSETLDETRDGNGDRDRRFSKREHEAPEQPGDRVTEILLDGKPMPLPQEMNELMSSIIMDFGEIPDDYLEPAGPGEYDPALFNDEQEDSQSVWSGVYHEEGAHLYPEWDYRRQNYRKNWCAVREKTVVPVHDDFCEKTLEKYQGLVKHLRKTFEAMRDEARLLKRQTQGDDVDLDALVEALAESRDGREMSDRLFTRMHRTERNIAVLFMVDMSGSTKGWINDAERESLVLLCEALETLGDRYAIYGFSSITRKRCELYPIKGFEEPYDDEIRARISGIRPQDYTRMGFAIRHLTRLLNEVDARTRILITLSDGKPDDYDSYRGDYGIEDTRRALIEARREGIHPYCITIDEEARDYLPHLYGPAAFTLVSEVRELPVKVSDIYRRLTT